MRKRLLSVIFLVAGLLTPLHAQNAASERLSTFHDQLAAIEDAGLRQTLENSIAAGLIESDHDFRSAVSRAEAIANNGSPILFSAYGSSRNVTEIRKQILELSAPITNLDRDAIKVEKNEKYNKGQLFKDYSGEIPVSYKNALALCEKFNPKAGTNDASRLDKDIDAFLATLKNDPVIMHALKVTNTTMEDLKSNWFGSGLGFEHVIAGETKGSKVSGFHWWYRFYDAERRGRADVLSSVAGMGNQKIYTGSFVWDPDGDGPLGEAKKPKGGFSNGHSVQALLALGHIAIETARSMGTVPGALTFNASVNGQEFNWQLYTMGGTIRSLYPMTGKGSADDDVFYDHEREVMTGR